MAQGKAWQLLPLLLFNPMVLRVWSSDRQHQQLLGTSWELKSSGPRPALEQGPADVLTSPLVVLLLTGSLKPRSRHLSLRPFQILGSEEAKGLDGCY